MELFEVAKSERAEHGNEESFGGATLRVVRLLALVLGTMDKHTITAEQILPREGFIPPDQSPFAYKKISNKLLQELVGLHLLRRAQDRAHES